MKRVLIAALMVAATGATANAQVNGILTEYGPALWSQNVGTQFGNNSDGTRDVSTGSEIDALFGSISGSVLNLGLAGNLETNFNHVLVFLDFAAGGQNVVSNTNADINFNNLNNNVAGMRFDTGFGADYVIDYTNGIGGGGPEHFLNSASMMTDGTGLGGFVGGGLKSDGAISGVDANGVGLTVDSDNSNILGVGNLGDPFDSSPDSVMTGIEMSIDLSSVGWDGSSPVNVAAFVVSGNFDFMSNQVVGGLPDGSGNLGTTSAVDFSQIEGLQYVTIVPAPSSLALLGLGGLAAARRRRA